MPKKNTFAVGILMLAIACGAAVGVAEQRVDAQVVRIGVYRPRLTIVLLDETGSRAKAWETMCEKAAVIASHLRNKDAFALIGIDDHGFDEDDVRIPLFIVQAPSDLMVGVLNQQRQALAQRVVRLKRRGNPHKTDIVGAVRQALDIANKESKQRSVVLAFFSDMQQTPKMPDAKSFEGIKFPEGTDAYCFYVSASGHYDFPTTVELWQRLFTAAGVAISANDFHQQGTVDVALNSAFP